MAGLMVFGAISFSRMGVSQLPDVDFPVVNVSVSWVGAAPETMELAVTDLIEDAVMSVEGVRSVSSRCQEGLSNTSVEFEINRDLDAALQEVQAKVSQVQRRLPTDIDPPVITKTNPEDQPILWAALSGGKNLREKILFGRDVLRDQITTVPGVGDVRLGGYVDPNMRIWLNANWMREKQITVQDVQSAISSESILVPTGYLDSGSEGGQKETGLKISSEASTVDEFSKLPISSRGGATVWSKITLGDVATIEEGLADLRRISRVNGEPSVGFGVIKQRGANSVSVAEQVKARIEKLKPNLPEGMNIVPVNDSSRFIKDSIHELLFTLGLSSILTALVCWWFLGSLSSAFNVILAIPVSLLGSFILLDAFGFTINTFTLLALSLSIGIVVDDAIMVLENIVRYFETGMSRVKAALLGAREIAGAATAASVAILAIFVPVVFMDGIIGKFFFQFGIAMSVAVMISLLEALTLAPMRCSQFLSGGERKAFQNRLELKYEAVLSVLLKNRWKVVIASTVLFLSSFLLLKGIKKEFTPSQDQSRFMVNLYTPLGSSLAFTDQVFKEAEKIILARPEVENVFVAVGGFQGGMVNQGNLFVMLKPKGERGVQAPFKKEPTQSDLMNWVRTELKVIKAAERVAVIDLSQGGFGGGSRMQPIEFQIQGPNAETLARLSQDMVRELRDSKLAVDVDSNYDPDRPEIKVLPDRAKAEARGVSVSTIANTLSALVGSLRVGKYTDASGHRNDVRVQLLDEQKRTLGDITQLSVRNRHGELVPLKDVVTIQEGKSVLKIDRYNRQRAIAISAAPAPGKTPQEGLAFAQSLGKKMLPAGYTLTLAGNSQSEKESFQNLLWALGLGIVVAYMVLGAQFNSFIHPITVLLALPFSVMGAFAALWLTGISLNIYSLIGILLLMGIVKKNSILLVEFTNQVRRSFAPGTQPPSVHEALLKACPIRLRPIIMTSVATIAAAVPAALAWGPGAESVRPMAVVVIGGVITSTLLTLLVVPCAYSLMSRLERGRHEVDLQQALAEIATK